MSVLTTTPPGTQATILEAVVASKYPRGDIPTIAQSYQLPVSAMQTILNKHGYPDKALMRAAAVKLRSEADTPAVTRDVEAGTPGSKTALVNVAVADLHPDPDNPRDKLTDLDDLVESITTAGLLQPIVARRNDAGLLVVVAGHRRLGAIKKLRWTHVDVLVRAPMRPDEVIAAMLIENGQRADLDPIEEARGIKRLATIHNLTDMAVARKIGRSQPYVSGRLALLNLTAEQQDEIRAGQMGVTAASQLGRQQAGKVRKSSKGNVTIHHFGETNELAARAKARCRSKGHKAKVAGGVGCGECWEAVIRADERQHAQVMNSHRDDCVTCGQSLPKGVDP